MLYICDVKLRWDFHFIGYFVANWLVHKNKLFDFFVYLNCEFIQFIIISVLCFNIKLLHIGQVVLKVVISRWLICGICVCIFLFWKWWDIIFQGRGVCNPREITGVIVLWGVIFYIWFISLCLWSVLVTSFQASITFLFIGQ